MSTTCCFQVTWIGRITGVSVSKMKPPNVLLLLGGSFSIMVVCRVSHDWQHWEFGVLRISGLNGRLSKVDCGWVWQRSHELIITELCWGVGRFWRELELEADFFCALRVLSVSSIQHNLWNLGLHLQDPKTSLLSLIILSGFVLILCRISLLSAMHNLQFRVFWDFLHLILSPCQLIFTTIILFNFAFTSFLVLQSLHKSPANFAKASAFGYPPDPYQSSPYFILPCLTTSHASLMCSCILVLTCL